MSMKIKIDYNILHLTKIKFKKKMARVNLTQQ